MSTFGLAQVKAAGESLSYEEGASVKLAAVEETFYFEQAFTKAEYAKLAALCTLSTDPFIVDLHEEFSRRAVNGYGGGA